VTTHLINTSFYGNRKSLGLSCSGKEEEEEEGKGWRDSRMQKNPPRYLMS
jgi:hypothetical protein